MHLFFLGHLAFGEMNVDDYNVIMELAENLICIL